MPILILTRMGLHLAYAGCETCAPDYRVQRDDFSCYSIEVVAAGRGHVVLDGNQYPLSAGTLFVYGPGIHHAITTDPAEPLVKYFAACFGAEIKPLLNRAGIPLGRTAQTLALSSVCTLFDQLLEEGVHNHRSSNEVCAAYLRILLLKAAPTGITSKLAVATTEDSFNRCREYINQHFTRLKSLQEIADHLKLRPPYLCRLFRQMGYPSPFQFLTHKKLTKAAELLVTEGKSVKETAHAVGYQDAYHFSRLFKSHYGQAPSQFAKLTGRQ